MSRPACLLSCFAVSMGCGTIYAFSAYAPQLSSQLGLSAKQIGTVGMAGNLAMSLSGPIAGAVVDVWGFTIPVIVSCVTTFFGYTIVRFSYDNSVSSMPLLSFALALIGIGATFAFSAAVRCAAANFARQRGFATAVTMAGYGVSAFVVTTLGRVARNLLSFLSFFPVSLMILFGQVVIANQPLTRATPRQYNDDYLGMVNLDDIPQEVHSRSRRTKQNEVGGIAMLKLPLFWSLATVLGFLAGTGQAYIYTCGYLVKALTIHGEDEGLAQTAQVSLLSLSNCAGRIIGGLLSDLCANNLRIDRAYVLVVATTLCIAASLSGYLVSTINTMWLTTVLTGSFYGIAFGCFPGIISDAFGMHRMSSNWGIIALSPIPVSFILITRMAAAFDANAVQGICVGSKCFKDAFVVHIALAISLYPILYFTIRRTRLSSSQ